MPLLYKKWQENIFFGFVLEQWYICLVWYAQLINGNLSTVACTIMYSSSYILYVCMWLDDRCSVSRFAVQRCSFCVEFPTFSTTYNSKWWLFQQYNLKACSWEYSVFDRELNDNNNFLIPFEYLKVSRHEYDKLILNVGLKCSA